MRKFTVALGKSRLRMAREEGACRTAYERLRMFANALLKASGAPHLGVPLCPGNITAVLRLCKCEGIKALLR